MSKEELTPEKALELVPKLQARLASVKVKLCYNLGWQDGALEDFEAVLSCAHSIAVFMQATHFIDFDPLQASEKEVESFNEGAEVLDRLLHNLLRSVMYRYAHGEADGPAARLAPIERLQYGYCKKCTRPIGWVKTTGGKLAPVDPDYLPQDGESILVFDDGTTGKTHTNAKAPGRINHFASCPNAADFRSKKDDRQGG
jgi:hypothetical protein